VIRKRVRGITADSFTRRNETVSADHFEIKMKEQQGHSGRLRHVFFDAHEKSRSRMELLPEKREVLFN
jgi:hypothetical protein